MIPQPPPGQGPVDPQGAFSPPPPPPTGQVPPPRGFMPPPPPPGMMPPGMMPPPPMGMYPPPMFYPPPAQGRGFSKAILVTLATTIFGLSLMANLYLLAFSGLF